MNPIFARLSTSPLLHLATDDIEIRQRGRLVQALVLILSFVAFLRYASILGIQFQKSSGEWDIDLTLALIQFVALLPFAFICLAIIRANRIRLAAHIFFAGFNTFVFLETVSDAPPSPFPYLFLISIVAIAFIDSVRASILYTGLTIVAAFLGTAVSGPTAFDFRSLATLSVTLTAISLSAWVTAVNLQNKTRRLQRRARQLEMGAVISQNTSEILNSSALLNETVEIIRREFGHYHVSIFLYDEIKNTLALVEATGEVGTIFKSINFHIPLNARSIVSWVASNRQARIAQDIGQDPFYRTESLLSMTQSEMAYPLMARGQLVGVLDIQSENPNAFDEEDIQVLQIMANQVAVNIDNARLLAQTETRIEQVSLINRLTTTLSLAPTLRDVYEGVRHEIFNLVDATGMSISLLSQDKQLSFWIYGYEYGKEVDLTSAPPIPANQGFSGHVVETREKFLIEHDIDKLKDELGSTIVGATPKVWLGLPLIVTNELIGVLAVENEKTFSDGELETLETIAGPIAIAIKNLLQLEEVQQALETQSRQRVLLQTASEVAAATTSLLNLDELLQQSVNLIQHRFSLYYVGLFLVKPNSNFAVLKAGTGKAGQAQLAEGRELAVGGRSLIGGATEDGRPRIIQDVTLDKEWLANPHLPETRAELALPLRVRGRITGALTVQSKSANAFDEEQVGILQTMSDQLAVAIENVQLLASAERHAKNQQRLNEISQRLYRSSDVNEIIETGLQALSERLSGAEIRLRLGQEAARVDFGLPAHNPPE